MARTMSTKFSKLFKDNIKKPIDKVGKKLKTSKKNKLLSSPVRSKTKCLN